MRGIRLGIFSLVPLHHRSCRDIMSGVAAAIHEAVRLTMQSLFSPLGLLPQCSQHIQLSFQPEHRALATELPYRPREHF